MTVRAPLWLDPATTGAPARRMSAAAGDTIDPALTGAIKFFPFVIASLTAGLTVPTIPSPWVLAVASASSLVFRANVAATAASTFTLRKNGVVVATITFAAGSAIATATLTSGAFSLAVGDFLTLTQPAVLDLTLAGVGGYVAGS